MPTPSPDAHIAEGIIADLESVPDSGVAPTRPPSSFVGTAPSQTLRRDWTDTRWAQMALRREFITTALICTLALLVWIAVFTSARRMPLDFTAAPTLREATRSWVGADQKPTYDQLVLFLRTSLSLLYEFSAEGAHFRPLLRGMVASRIIEEADAYLAKNLQTIQRDGIRQTFRMEPVKSTDIIQDRASNRISVTVRGSFELARDKVSNARPVIIPFSARVIVSPNTPSQIDPFLFYLEAIDRGADPVRK